MIYRLLAMAIAAVILVLLFRSIYRDAAEKLRELIDQRRAPKLLGKVEEPRVRIEKARDKVVLRIALPDVESEANVHLRKLSRSIEVKAYGKNKVYFKLVPVPKNSKLLSKRLVEKEFIVELSAGEG